MPPKSPAPYAAEWSKRFQLALLLKQLREGVRNITQASVAAALGKITRTKPPTTQAVSRWMLGLSVPDSATQIALAQWLEVDPGWLVAGDRSAAPAPQTPAKLMSVDITAPVRRRRQSNEAANGHDRAKGSSNSRSARQK